MSDNGPIFLKIKGGWISPDSIRHVQTHRDNAAMLIIGVVGIEQPIPLNEADSAYIAAYLESRTWHMPSAENDGDSKVIPARPEPKLMVTA